MVHDPLRRRDILRMTPAEIAIRNAVIEVEKVGADPALTDAVSALTEAASALGDYIDGVDRS